MTPHSLGARLTLGLAVVLIAFLGLAGLALERAFRESVEQAVRENLEVQVYLLLGAAEVDAAGQLRMPDVLSEPRLATPESGLYAAIRDASGERLWQSESSIGLDIGYPGPAATGNRAFARIAAPDGRELFGLRHAVSWETEGENRRLVFLVAESAEAAAARVATFRRTLWGWFGGVAILLLLLQALLLRWGLRPLRRAAREVTAIERGERARIGTDYPRELRPLTASVNELLASGASRLERYREALADLGHSLKNPLAVLRSIGDDPATGDRGSEIRDQVERMQQAIDWHVQRGAAAGRGGLGQSVALAELVERVGASLARVHADRGVRLACDIPRDAVVRGDPDDLMEIVGNLLDNAWKWGRTRIRATSWSEPDGGLVMAIEDDGPGIPADRRDTVLERGVRIDESVPGDGIGLAVVRRMIEETWGGRLGLEASDLGGLRVWVTFPPRSAVVPKYR
ncbi:ATP-binding protein [Halofilum ochraceum]|uniref:ATP-binding protein n=1 Tax=Halofilum ochraceum TaxID=1611323 RepID=UPI0008D934C0|nr:ATP-binding protein [Halofilum ochraceum]